MPLNTQADVFISTLAELVAAERERQADRLHPRDISTLAELAAAERERQADRLRLRHKANADRFMRAFPDRARRSHSFF